MYLYIGIVNLRTQITNDLSMGSYHLKDGKRFISTILLLFYYYSYHFERRHIAVI